MAVKAEAISLTAIEKAIMGEQHDGAIASLMLAKQSASNLSIRDAVNAELGDEQNDNWFTRYLALQKERHGTVAAAEANLKSVTPENGAFSVASQYVADSVLQQLMIAEKNDKVDTGQLRQMLTALNDTVFSMVWDEDTALPELRFMVPEVKKRGSVGTGNRSVGNRSTSGFAVEGRAGTPVRIVVRNASAELWGMSGQTPRMVSGSLETDLHIPARQYADDGSAATVNASGYAGCVQPFMQAFAIASGVATTDDMRSTADGGYYQRQRVIPGSEVTEKNRHTGLYTTDAEGNTHSPENAPTDWFRCYRIPNPKIGGEMRDYEVCAWLLKWGATAVTFYNAAGECVSHTELLDGVAVRDIGGNGKVGFVRPLCRGFAINGFTNAYEHDGKAASATDPVRITTPVWAYHPECEGEVDDTAPENLSPADVEAIIDYADPADDSPLSPAPHPDTEPTE